MLNLNLSVMLGIVASYSCVFFIFHRVRNPSKMHVTVNEKNSLCCLLFKFLHIKNCGMLSGKQNKSSIQYFRLNICHRSLHLFNAFSVFLSYTGFVIGVAFVLIWCVRPSVSAQNPLIYITITGTIGSLTVMSCKGLGVALKETFSGTNRLTNPITYILLLSVIVCIIIQLNYMNKALDLFQTAVVSPLLYVVFTSCVILASVLLFHEWKGLSSVDIVSIICAFLVILVGVFLLQYFKDINVSITQTKVVTNVNPSPTKKLPIS